MNTSILGFTLAATVGLLPATGAMGQPAAWPSKAITLIVPSTAGGPLDGYARIAAEELGKELKQPTVVENRAGGGGGLIAARGAMQAPADGHTLFVGTAAILTINPSAYKQLPYAVTDFAYVCKGVEAPLVLVAHPSLGVKDLAALGQRLKSKPSEAMYASYQAGTPSHFLGHQLGEKLGVAMTHVPYKGSSPQVQDLVGGNVGFGFTQLQTALQHVRAGKLVALATTGAQRAPQLPDVPTLAELAMPDLTTTVWFGLVVHKDTPRDVVDRLIAVHKAAFAAPATRAKVEAQSMQVSGQCGADFEKAVRDEGARWARVVKATGFSASD
jgi:tripartite-type tricarboxylate transporter receptor subunit TctC